MSTCKTMPERISALVDGCLRGREKLEVMEHLSVCPACRAVFEDYTAMGAALAKEVPAPAGFADGVMARVAATPQDAKKHPAVSWRRWAAAAACCALAVVGVWTMGAPRAEKAAVEAGVYSVAVTADTAAAEDSMKLRSYSPEASTLPGQTAPTLLWEGKRYEWAAVSDWIPDAYGEADALRRVEQAAVNGDFTADFAAEGVIYDDPATDHCVYVRITTDWLEDAIVRFDLAE